MKKRFLSLLCAVALLAGLWVVPAAAAGGVTLTAQGWLETSCAEISGVTKADIVAVEWESRPGSGGSMTPGETTEEAEHGAFSFKYLVRDMAGGGVRIDIPGLAPDTYTLTVRTAGQNYTAENIAVKAHDRSGFAHWVYDEKTGTGSRYTQGVGAYRDDGTLKDNAYVIYVTDENKDTINITTKDDVRNISVTGIGNMLNSNNTKKNLFLLRAITRDYPTYHDGTPHTAQPLVVRFVGSVTRPAEGLSEPSFALEKNSTTKYDGSNGFMCYMLSARNMTIEGIGPDGGIDGWGLSFGADNNDAKEGLANNFELRNMTFRNVPEDCIEITGREDGTSHALTCPVEHAWIHNNSFHVPTIPFYTAPDKPDDGTPYTWVDDKKEGDGATDVKCSQYITYSYNYYDSYHKTGLVGGGDEQLTYHLTYHHNYYYNVDQRCPLARQADIHLYNNVYEKQRGYCVSLRANTYVFSEYNTFINCKNPIKDEGSGGVCKSYNDSFDASCTGNNNAEKVMDRDDPITKTSANPYAGFELNARLSYIPDGDYQIEESTADVRKVVDAYTGTIKALDAITHPTVHHHVWGAWTVVKANSCTEGGQRWRVCSAPGCPLEGGRDDQDTPAWGHNYQSSGRCALCGALNPSKTYSVTADGVYGVLTAGGNSSFNASTGTFSAAANVTAGDDGFFTLHFPSGGQVDTSSKTFEGTKCARRIRFKNGVSSSNGSSSVEFTTTGPATVKIWWVAGGDNRQMAIWKAGGSKTTTKETVANNGQYISTVELKDAGTYYLGGDGGNNYIFGVFVTTASSTLAGGTMGDEDGLRWSYNDQGELSVTGLEEDQTVLAATFDRTGRFAGLEKLLPGKLKTQLDCGFKVRLFWLDDIFQIPQSAKVEF